MAGVLLSKTFAKRVNEAVKRVEAMERSGHAFRRNPAPSYFGGGLISGVITGATLIRPNIWRYKAKRRYFDIATEAMLPEAQNETEVTCYNWREMGNDGAGEENSGVTVGVVGGATITLKPVRIGCPIFMFRVSGQKPAKLTQAGSVDPDNPPMDDNISYLFEVDNAVNVSCGT